jgi:hypothetical protein
VIGVRDGGRRGIIDPPPAFEFRPEIEEGRMPHANPDRLMRLRIWWLAVLAANLPGPLYFGIPMTADGGWVGLLLAIGLVWLLGHMACRWTPWLASAVIVGGWCVAAGQLWPIAQIAAGIVGMHVGAGGEMRARGPWAGFVATFVTGGALLAVAAILGAPLRVIFEEHVSALNREPPASKPRVELDELA